MAVTFKGFSSPQVGRTKVLYDVDLVRRDLLNHFYTHKGERVMDVDYGFIGWDLIFELDNIGNKQLLESDARNIVSQDPRLNLISINVDTIEYGYVVRMVLQYVQLQKVETLELAFDSRSRERMTFNVT